MELGVFLELFASGHGPGATSSRAAPGVTSGIRIVLDVRRAESPEWSLVSARLAKSIVLLCIPNLHFGFSYAEEKNRSIGWFYSSVKSVQSTSPEESAGIARPE